MQPLPIARPIALSVTASGTFEVDADQGRIRQVVFNLLSNAIKFTPNGGEVRAELSADRHGCRWAVIDTGTGIAGRRPGATSSRRSRQVWTATRKGPASG